VETKKKVEKKNSVGRPKTLPEGVERVRGKTLGLRFSEDEIQEIRGFLKEYKEGKETQAETALRLFREIKKFKEN